MRINESMLQPGKALCKDPVVLISWFQVLPRSMQDLFFTTPEDAFQASVHFPDPKDWVQFSLLSTPGSAILRMGKVFGEILESVWEQVPTRHCLLCHPESTTSYKEGREQELFSSRYLRRLLTSTVFLVMRRAGARLRFLRSELILEVKESSTSHNWPDSASWRASWSKGPEGAAVGTGIQAVAPAPWRGSRIYNLVPGSDQSSCYSGER